MGKEVKERRFTVSFDKHYHAASLGLLINGRDAGL